MSAGWGIAGINNFIQTRHRTVSPAIDPARIALPRPFVVCVVGASRGIGAGIATAYARAGCSALVLASRRVSGLERTAADCRAIQPGVDVEIVPCDISSAPDVERLADVVRERFGRLDVAVVNSGYSGPVVLRVTDTSPDTFARATGVNYFGTFLCAKFLIPLLLATPANGHNRALFGVSSLAVAIVKGAIANAQYCVSKAAQLRLLESVHEQFQGEGLAVFAVHPGGVLTEMAEETAPEEVKGHLIDSPDLCGAFCVWVTGKGEEARWLSGRLLSAKWDVGELEARKGEVVERDLLKMKIAV